MHRHDEQRNKRRYDSAQWHSDIQFEPAPADYTSLRLTQLPKTGGDTLWASGYEMYDRFSKPYQKFFEGLTATYIGEGFLKAAEVDPNVVVYTEPRGNPLNVGRHLSTVHPIVRTNPVTGWNSIYSVGPFPKYINELNPEESDEVLKKFYRTIIENHDLTVRFKWRNEHDIGESLLIRSSSLYCFNVDTDHYLQLFGTTAPLSTLLLLIMRVLESAMVIVPWELVRSLTLIPTVNREPRI